MNFKYEGKGYYYEVVDNVATLYIEQKKRTHDELMKFVDNALKKSNSVYYATTHKYLTGITVKEYTIQK